MVTQAVVSYLIYSLFVFYQQLHVKNFNGGSQGFHLALSMFAMISMLAGFGLLIWFAIAVSWPWALGAFLLSLVVPIPWFAIEGALKIRHLAPYISVVGFIAIPASGYFLWASIV
jgi:hypothetical protein